MSVKRIVGLDNAKDILFQFGINYAVDTENCFLIHFVVNGPPGSALQGGEYYGTIDFSREYPEKQPIIQMYTPTGIFPVLQDIQLFQHSIAWNKDIPLTTIFVVLRSAMIDPSFKIYSEEVDNIEAKQNLASMSSYFNISIPNFSRYFVETHEQFSESQPFQMDSKELLRLPICNFDFGAIKEGNIDEISKVNDAIELVTIHAVDLYTQNCTYINGQTYPVIKVVSFSSGNSKDGIRLNLAANMKKWNYLKHENNKDGMTLEDFRDHSRNTVWKLLDTITEFGEINEIEFVFTEIDLSLTDSSMRSIFGGESFGRAINRETLLETLNLSHTHTSARSLLSLHNMVNLREIYLDYCPDIEKFGKNIFKLLASRDPIPNLELLSVIKTSCKLSQKWFSIIEKSCPKIRTVFFTRKPGTKAVGWRDSPDSRSMKEPHLAPCGHFVDISTFNGYCQLDNIKCNLYELIAVDPMVSLLEKDQNDEWNSQIVDATRKPLESVAVVHLECGSFYNYRSLTDLFSIHLEQENTSLGVLRNFFCTECDKPLTNCRICYPVDIGKQSFGSLQAYGSYSY
eukprot:TRINITY_DN13384_c0_g1_i1.p1 TRINITY_DN13384_c0_g1~~TRINITY_DN13384_c0_g1_i1.p1  ORF type:complete len:569 (+),score=76.95 TRINITY_DN13384_c0_g1_i1:568-2274(+)